MKGNVLQNEAIFGYGEKTKDGLKFGKNDVK